MAKLTGCQKLHSKERVMQLLTVRAKLFVRCFINQLPIIKFMQNAGHQCLIWQALVGCGDQPKGKHSHHFSAPIT
jgi:hypothetical protein